MEEGRIKCTKCKAMILPSTAKETDGLCMPCYKGDTPTTFDKVEVIADNIGFGIRLIFAIFGCIVATSLGYAVGSSIWSALGLFCAIIMAPVGLIVGFILPEIRLFAGSALKALFFCADP